MSILSIQSHVCYGYVGNRAATFPLQSLGYDVWAVNTVQFSNHTGYGTWKGQIFSAEHIAEVIAALKERQIFSQCQAVLSGYLGDPSIGKIILDTVDELRTINPKLIYLCDPVMGDVDRGFFVKEGIPDFFKQQSLARANIITPNHFEANALFGSEICSLQEAKNACESFHQQGVKTVVITSFQSNELANDRLYVYLSTSEKQYLCHSPAVNFQTLPNGMGDLFSALFLGHYLHSKEAIWSLKKSVSNAFDIVQETQQLQQRELKIIRPYHLQAEVNSAVIIEEL